MASLERGQENSTDKLNWFTTFNGVTTDVDDVGYRIFDITAGLPGTQIFPVTPGEYHSVGSGSGKFGTGSYYAYDNDLDAPWTAPAGAALGTHRIEWRWRLNPSSQYSAHAEDFEIIAIGAGSGGDTYITVADIRDEGLLIADYSDATVLAAIYTWQAFIERACRQWFIPKTKILSLNGTDSDTLLLGVPIISIEYIKLNGETSELSSDYYAVYSAQSYPDDRRNPKISLKSGVGYSIYNGYGGTMKFLKGRQNQEIKGIFGFTEEDGSVPLLIKRALTKLVIEKLTKPMYGNMADSSAAPPLVGALLEEWTDGHKIKYDNAGGKFSKRKVGLIGITEDQEIHDIIKLYRAPLGAAAPMHPSHM